MRNTKLKIISTVILGLMLLPIASFAETGSTTSTTTRASIKTEIEKRREEAKNKIDQNKQEFELRKEEIKQGMETKREELKQKVEERKQMIDSKIEERLSKFISKLEERFNSAIERLEILVTRIESRIAKMDEEDIDTTKAKELLTEAKGKIEIAKTSILAIGTKADEVLAGDTRALYPELKTVVEKAKSDIKSAHEALINVVRELKPGFNKSRDGRDKNATSTATTTNS